MWEEGAWPRVTQVGKLLATLVQPWPLGARMPPLRASLPTLEEGAEAALAPQLQRRPPNPSLPEDCPLQLPFPPKASDTNCTLNSISVINIS